MNDARARKREKQQRYRERKKAAAADAPIDLRPYTVYTLADERGCRVHGFCPAGTEPPWRDLPADSPAAKWIAAYPGARLTTQTVRGERRAHNMVTRTPRYNPDWILANESPGTPPPAVVPYPDDDRQFAVFDLRERSPRVLQAPYVHWFGPADLEPPWRDIDPDSPAGLWIATTDWVASRPETVKGLDRVVDRALGYAETMHYGPVLSVFAGG
jgi:hypothetical protein